MKKIEVVAGIIKHENLILCVQKDKHKFEYISNKFEFPGGKIERDETQIEALERELLEELEIETSVNELFLTVNHQYPDFKLIMHSYICDAPSKNIVLTEHIDQKWLPIKDLSSLDWAAADLPIVEKLMKNE